jgi:hypothetical protein
MALDIDGFTIFRSIAAHPSAFPDVAAAAAKAARTLVVAQIKCKTTGLSELRDIRKALGEGAFSLILDGIPDPQIKSLVNKLDKHHPELKASNAQWRRRQISALADGSVEPAAKPATPPKREAGKKKKSKQAAVLELLDFTSAGATRKR